MSHSLSRKTKLTCLLQTVGVSSIAALGCSFNSLAQVTTPDSDWTIKSTVTDCSATTSYTVAESSDSCQSYSADIYENWDLAVAGSGDTDIAAFSVGFDNDFFYFQQDLREDWNYDLTGESKTYHIDLDADFASASGGDSLSDFLVVYNPLATDVGSTWTAEGFGRVELYEDLNNDLGGPNPNSSDWDCGSSCDGIASPVTHSSSDAYVRIVNGNIEIAIRRSILGSPEKVRARAWATQTSTLDKATYFFHDKQQPSDLASNRMDNTASADTSQWQVLNTYIYSD
ncbi:MAG: hypothetical protein QNJ55_07980 [Xenococcus sp. MO_188.B8]|nr:hypothetical protein [Xenococcus sp. MO_188.B8]